MATTDKNTIKNWFLTGLKPTQAQFHAWMDSYWHKDETIPQSSVSNLTTTLNAKAEKSQFDAHKTDPHAHEESIGQKTDRGGYTGTSQEIVNRVAAIENPDRVLKFGTITVVGLNVSIDANAFAWVLNRVSFLTPAAFSLPITAATDGMYRTDSVVGNGLGTYEIIKGFEAATGGAAAEPAPPVGTIRLGFISLFGNTITGSASTPSIEKTTIVDADRVVIDDSGDSFSKKSVKWLTIKNLLNTLFLGTATNQDVTGVKTFLNGMFGFRNGANTFTSFFTNSNTASRTYTFQNRNGIIADDTDLAGKMAAPSLTVNKIPRAIASNAIGNSRITDDGYYIGIDNQWVLLEDLIFGYLQASRTFGIEDSESTVAGRPLYIRGGRASNKTVSSTTFMPLSQTSRDWRDMVVAPNGDVYACVFGGDIYKQTGGTGNFVALGQTSRNWSGLACNSAGDVYATDYNSTGNIYKQTGGTGNFISLAQTGRYYSGITCHPNGDVYASVYAVGSGIFKQTGGTGTFNSLGVATLSWTNIKAAANGDVYACVINGDIYKQAGGTGGFVGLGQTSRAWAGLATAPNGDVYASVGNKFTAGSSGDIYKQTAGTGNFIGLGQASRLWNGLAVNSVGNVYACVAGVDLYFLNQSTTGSPDLDGGALNLVGAAGKGTGKSRVNFITGAKLSSGTTVQTEILRAYYDENGNYIFLTIPTYANDAAADADSNLPSKAYYKLTGNRAVYQKP